MAVVIDELVGPSDPEFAVALAVRQAAAGEIEPDVPPIGPLELAGELLAPPAHEPVRTWVAALDGRPAGVASIEQYRGGDNDNRAFVTVDVLPGARRRGVARALLATALPALDDGVDELIGAPPFDAGAGLCRSLGLTWRQEERYSRLRVADVDADQQRRWVEEAPGRSRGYRVVCWSGPCPDEHMAAWCAANDAMADAPLDDVAWVTPATTPERIRAAEVAAARRTLVPFLALALGPDGSAAGMTELWVIGERPQVGEQGDTAVVAAHRGHGLGRWLKAANLAQARAAHPELAVVGTYNAETNPWMLAINVDQGYRPHLAYGIYQGPRPA